MKVYGCCACWRLVLVLNWVGWSAHNLEQVTGSAVSRTVDALLFIEGIMRRGAYLQATKFVEVEKRYCKFHRGDCHR